MTTQGMVSIIIPSRNEKYLQKTIRDIQEKATGSHEIIAVLDGYWPDEVIDNVTYLHYTDARGMRNAINSGVAIAKGEYILKTDAHCMFAKGFDEVLKADIKDNWVVVPRRYALDPDKWDFIDNPKYPVDYMYLDRELHGRVWEEKNKDSTLRDKPIDDLMSSQGSCWFMKKTYYEWLELLDEDNYGRFFNEFQEIGLKCWLSGGEVKVNKKTWYAHWHKPKAVGRGYKLTDTDGTDYINNWKKSLDLLSPCCLSNFDPFGEEKKDQKGIYQERCLQCKKLCEPIFTPSTWVKQKYSLKWLINKFAPVPTW